MLLELCLDMGQLQGSNDTLHHIAAPKQADDCINQKYSLVEERVFQVTVAVGDEDSQALNEGGQHDLHRADLSCHI